jgi:hypothetical protein
MPLRLRRGGFLVVSICPTTSVFTMANINFGTGFYVSAQARVVNQVSDRQVTDNLRVTRVVVLKNQPIGGTNEDGTPRTRPMTVRVDFKNLSDEQLNMLTIGSLIRFEGELMEQSFQPEGSEDWVNFNVIEAWDFLRVAASKAERDERKAQAEPVGKPVKRQVTQMQAEADTLRDLAHAEMTQTDPTDYSDLQF